MTVYGKWLLKRMVVERVNCTRFQSKSKEKHEDVMLDCYPSSNDCVLFICDIDLLYIKVVSLSFFMLINMSSLGLYF